MNPETGTSVPEIAKRKPSDLPMLLKMGEAATFLNVSYKTIQRWKVDQDISVVVLGRNKNIVRIPRSEIERILRGGFVAKV